MTFKDCIKHRQTILVCICAFCGNIPLIFLMVTAKSFGESRGVSDFSLSISLSIATFVNGGSRLIMGLIFNKYGTKKLLIFNFALGTIVSVSFYFAVKIEWLFCLLVILSAWQASCYVIYFSHCGHLFGSVMGGRVYSIVVAWSNLGAIFNSFISFVIVPYMGGYLSAYIFCGFMSFIGIICSFFIEEKQIIIEGEEEGKS